MPFLFNPFTGNFDVVTNSSEDLSALQAEVNALDSRVDQLEIDIVNLESFAATFTTGTWTGPVSNSYSLTVLAGLHGKTEPSVQVFELVGGNYEQVDCSVSINANKDVTISVNQIPDLRFNGKIIIS